MKESETLFDTIVKLMNFGAAGVGVIVMLFVFFIVVRGKQADPGTLDLSKMLLRYGLGFATVCALLALAAPLLQPGPSPTPAEIEVKFSPSFATEMLPAPLIELSGGKYAKEGDSFVPKNGLVLVRFDDSLKAVKALKETVQTLAATATTAQKQADAATKALTEASASDGAASSAQAEAVSASLESQASTASIATSVARGDFAKLATANKTLNEAASDSFRARSAVIRRASQ